MTLEAIKCRLLLHYPYTLAEKACKYWIFCFHNIKYIDKKNFLQRISNLCYGAYLVSAIFDQLFYPFLIELVPNMLHRLYYYPIIVPMIFVCSLLLSYILSILYKPFIQEK